jgi:hypothetical protein
MTFSCKSRCLSLIPSAPSVLQTPIDKLSNLLQVHSPVSPSLFPLHLNTQHKPSTPTSTSYLHQKTNSDTMDHSDEPKYTCKCGQVFDLYEPRATTSEDTISTTDGARKPSQRVPHTHLDFVLEFALPVFFCVAAACWLHTVYHYVRSVYF